MYDKLKECLERELQVIVDRGNMSDRMIEMTHTLTDTIKNIEKIQMIEGQEVKRIYTQEEKDIVAKAMEILGH